jgi:formate dehydrogenase iron-sulfur subunit
MAMTVLAGFFHYVRVGPNETDAGDEDAANEMARTAVTKEKVP